MCYERGVRLADRLLDHVVVGDGAMGSELLARIPAIRRLDLAPLEHPREVLQIHLDYLAAGAEIVQTATFTASRPRLEELGSGGDVELVNATAVKLAREAREVAGVDALVAGSIGPLAGTLDPGDPEDRSAIAAAHAEQAAVLAGRGADLIVLESFFRMDELELAVEAVRGITRIPLIALLTFPAERAPHPWSRYAEAVARAAALPVDAVGINCAPGPMGTLEIVERMPALARPLAVQPNAGVVVRQRDRKLLTPATPQYLARFAREAVAAGAAWVGGCCGTGPEHIEAVAQAVRGLRPPSRPDRRIVAAVPSGPPRPEAPPPPARAQASPFAGKLAAGRFVTVVQLDPPRGTALDGTLEAVRAMARHGGVDAVDINANPLGRLRMDALWTAAAIRRECGIDTIPHVTPRDASVMGLQAQLLGAWRAGIRNLLAITGDPSQIGEYAGQHDVYDVDIFELVRAIVRMAEGVDWAGNAVGSPPSFTVGVAVDPGAPDPREEADRLRRKIDAGARFALTQVFFEWAPWERFLELFGGALPIPALVAVWPLTSFKLALRLHHEVPGISVPPDLLDALERAGAGAAEVGRQRALELLRGAPERAAGVYLIAPFRRPAAVLDLLDGPAGT